VLLLDYSIVSNLVLLLAVASQHALQAKPISLLHYLQLDTVIRQVARVAFPLPRGKRACHCI
jgi:hypothetical protein